jgi:hypothetical protein
MEEGDFTRTFASLNLTPKPVAQERMTPIHIKYMGEPAATEA